MKIYLIHGIIFQMGECYSIDNKPGIGAAVKAQKAMLYAIFHGIVNKLEHEKTHSGEMKDQWGKSTITDFIVEADTMSFTKHYEKRPPIYYKFYRNPANSRIWEGGYTGEDSGIGTCKCILNVVDEDFFLP